ncbi:MaoC/PaaZ C-terminal domain-containing protein [Streptomyces sp. LUP47B]|uniref:MaoC/PaaZ C-terminal domain-containing protein n=1 Tax=Streptomyces sp. LUP47B TaxID=1890286 RepID=UPI000A3FA4C5|nr:MaoC/PaaZ C-terminal domain-containing protein [Streptomyces sp. LUP47B]
MTTSIPTPVGYRQITEGRYREVVGLGYYELREGMVIEHRPGRTITEADNTVMTTLGGNDAPIHTDAHYSSLTEWGRPLVCSSITLHIVGGMTVRSTSGLTLANLLPGDPFHSPRVRGRHPLRADGDHRPPPVRKPPGREVAVARCTVRPRPGCGWAGVRRQAGGAGDVACEDGFEREGEGGGTAVAYANRCGDTAHGGPGYRCVQKLRMGPFRRGKSDDGQSAIGEGS